MFRSAETGGYGGGLPSLQQQRQITGTLQLNDFTTRLQSLSPSRPIDANLIRDVASRFASQRAPQMIDYEEFVKSADFEQKKVKLIENLFQTLQSSTDKLAVRSLRELFTRVAPQLQQYFQQPTIDRQTVEQVLKVSGFAYFQQYEIDILMLEYEPIGQRGKFDLDTFDKEFREFTQGASNLNFTMPQTQNVMIQDFNSFMSQAPRQQQQYQQPIQPIGGMQQQQQLRKPQTQQVSDALRQIALKYQQDRYIKMGDILQKYMTNMHTGAMPVAQFESKLVSQWMLRYDDAYALINHYDPTQRKEVRVQEFLDDVGDHVTDMSKKMELINVKTQFGEGLSHMMMGGVHDAKSMILQNFGKDFEEIQKALVIKGGDPTQWFASYSQQSSRTTVTRRDLNNALMGLSLSRQFTEQDFDQIFNAFDPQRTQFLDIKDIVDAIQRSISATSTPQLQEDIMDKIIRAYSGDDSFLQRELYKQDKTGRGMVEQPQFISFLRTNSPVQFILNDLQFLAMKFVSNTGYNPPLVDVNSFISEFRRVLQKKGLKQGVYSLQTAMAGMGRVGMDQSSDYTSGHINPMLGMGMRNTKTEQIQRNIRDSDRINYAPQINDNYFEDVVKGTYIKSQTVYDYFVTFSQNLAGQKPETLQSQDFERAIVPLAIGWSHSSAENFFTQLDQKLNAGRRTGFLTAMQIDEGICFGCKKSIDQLQDEVLRQVVEQAITRDYDFRALLTAQDIGRQMLVSVDALCDVVLNKMKVATLNKADVVFLAKKYIKTLPNSVQYEQLLDDFNLISKSSFGSVTNFKSICAYIRKACIVKQALTEPEQFFKGYIQVNAKEQMLILPELVKGCVALGLVPEVCQESHITQMFGQIETTGTKKITLRQLGDYIKKMSSKSTKEFQDDIIEEIAIKLRSTGASPIDKLFKTEDPRDLGYVKIDSFSITLSRTYQIKDIDSKLLAQRYIERTQSAGDVAYKKFVLEVQNKVNSVAMLQKSSGSLLPNNVIGVGIHNQDQGSEIAIRLKKLLVKLNQEVVKLRLSLVNLLSKYENVQGHMAYDQFIQVLKGQYIDLSDDDFRFLAENYLVVPTQTKPGVGARVVDYQKFLSDLKLHGAEPVKQLQSLTREQELIYKKLTDHLKQSLKTTQFAQTLVEKDPSIKGYLPTNVLQDAFRKHGYNFDKGQFANIFGALDPNHQGELNYKQMLDIILGPQDSLRFFSGLTLRAKAGGLAQSLQPSQFKMPLQPTGNQSAPLGLIGKKFITAGRNYEDEFRQRIGEKEAGSAMPRATEQDLDVVMTNCGVRISQDERNTLAAWVQAKRDGMGMFPVLEFLQSIGLPPQTLGLRGQRAQMPKRLLTDKERKYAQEILIKLRTELKAMNKNLRDVLKNYRESDKDLSMPEFRFKMLLTSGEFGPYGRQVTDDMIKLLVYYLTQETPGEVSFKKLELAFLQTDRDQPLTQEGADEIRKYESLIKDQARKGIPLEIMDLCHHINTNKLTMQTVFKTATRGGIPVKDFEQALRDVGYKAQDPLKLIEMLDKGGKRQFVDLDLLNSYMAKMPTQQRGITTKVAMERYQGFDPKAKSILQRISEFLKNNNITLNKLYTTVDHNHDGMVTRDEFVSSMPAALQIQGVDARDYAILYNALDVNNDGSISLHEFGMFIEGVKLQKNQRMQELDPRLVQTMNDEIAELFRQFDLDGNGYVTADEIQKAMLGIGQRISLDDAMRMIREVDQNGDNQLELKEFQDLMMRRMKDELLAQEDNVEDLKAKFMDADVDHSGTLSVDELYGVLKIMGVELSLDELVELMQEIDVDRNGQLDIDEFVALISGGGDQVQLNSAGAKNTLYSIKKARKLNPLDFFKQFKAMPGNFVPSFITERWNKKMNLPSSVFMPQIDPRTMLYKDLLPVLQENIAPNVIAQKQFHPRVRPIPAQIGCSFYFEEAQGVPLPANSQFDRSQIVKRAVRVALYDTTKKEYIANSVQVNALYRQDQAEDIWQFQEVSANGLNPIIFKAAIKDDIIKPHIFLVFELVIVVQFSGGKTSEMSCGWCQLDMGPNGEVFTKSMPHKLPIKGGSPNAELLIKDTDVHTNRTGIKHQIMKVVNSKITSQLTVQVRPLAKFNDEARLHIEFLPKVCFVQYRLLYIVSGFRNYLGEKFLKEMSQMTFKKPEGDSIVTTFAKVLDCPDICEVVSQIWSEDVWAPMNSKQRQNIENLILKTKEFLRRLYPVLYAERFNFKESNTTASASGDQQLMKDRDDLLRSALRFGNPQAKVKVDKPIETMTSFKPFTVRELDFEVWDDHSTKNERYLQQHFENSENTLTGYEGAHDNYYNPGLELPQKFTTAGRGNLGVPPQMNPQQQFSQAGRTGGGLGVAPQINVQAPPASSLASWDLGNALNNNRRY